LYTQAPGRLQADVGRWLGTGHLIGSDQARVGIFRLLLDWLWLTMPTLPLRPTRQLQPFLFPDTMHALTVRRMDTSAFSL
jgi:hypothetical protein